MPKKTGSPLTNLEVTQDFADYIANESKRLKKEPNALLKDLMSDGFYVLEVEEALGKTTEQLLTFYKPDFMKVGSIEPVEAGQPEPEDNLKKFRELRDWGPVSAGIDWHLAFLNGGGFIVTIDNPKDDFQKEVREVINQFNRNVFQDELTSGLDKILDIMCDAALTEGTEAAEIVYTNNDKFTFETQQIGEGSKTLAEKYTIMEGGKQVIKWHIYEPDWKELKGIAQLKIIDNTSVRLKPYRDPETYQILYFTLDEKSVKEGEEVKKLHVWQVLWLGWDATGTNLFGRSRIKPIADLAFILKDIQSSIGKSFKRWGNKRFFFILGSEKRPWALPHIRNFGTDVKKMVDQNGTAISVPYGFDVKEIGGEVFDGRQILDHFLDQIIGGMEYPKAFYLQSREEVNETAWLGWQSRYGKSQRQLRRDIEHQLWRRHLWCLYGKERDIVKQGPQPKSPKKESIYIPKMQWRSEGKWHIKQKIEELTKLLNVANPILAETKLAVEEDISQTLGYSELDYENAQKMLDINQKIAMFEAQIEQAMLDKLMTSKEYLKPEVYEAWLAKKYGVPQKPEEEQGKPDEKNMSPEELHKARMEKRSEKGVSLAKHPTGGSSKQGKAKNMGGTRTPADQKVQEVVEDPEDELYLERMKTYKMAQEAILKLKETTPKEEKKEGEVK